MGGWEVAEATDFCRTPSRWRTDAVEFCTAKPLGSQRAQGPRAVAVARDAHHSRDHRARHRARSHRGLRGQLRRHELREDCPTSASSSTASKLLNVTCDKNSAGLGSTGYDDDGVKTQEWPLIRDGILVGLQTNRETAHLIGEDFESRGCTFGTSWRDYPFLRMPNVHVDAGPEARRRSRSSWPT
jgi:hypothetical protein